MRGVAATCCISHAVRYDEANSVASSPLGRAMSDTTPTRRDFLRTAAASTAGLALAQPVLGRSRPALRAGVAQSCIVINMVGGPAHIDTFDPKPDAPSDVRGPFRPIPTNVPGIHLSELFPKLARHADKFSLIRSMNHDAPPVHECGFQLLNTGRLFRDGPEWPSVGCVWTHLHDEHAAGAGRRHYVAPTTDLETGISIGMGFGPGFLPGWSPTEMIGANFRDDATVQQMRHRACVNDDYPMTAFGQNCYGALKSVQKRPGRFLTVNQFSTVFDAPSWDCHADGGSLHTTLADVRESVAPSFDAAFAQLLEDLHQRGLLESTLVVATGEFGRTPRLNANGGRDHWSRCWTAIVAGGGILGGQVIGRSDPIGSEPTERPVSPQELVASIFHALGVAHDTTIPGPDGTPVTVYPAAPVAELF